MTLEENIKEAVELLFRDVKNPSKILKEGGLVKQLTKALLERALESEMDEHMGYKEI